MYADTFAISGAFVVILAVVAAYLQPLLGLYVPDRFRPVRNALEKALDRDSVKAVQEAIDHPGLRYLIVGSLPFLPAGGGGWIALALAIVWRLAPGKVTVIVGTSNAAGFLMYQYFGAGSWGWYVVVPVLFGAALTMLYKRLVLSPEASQS